MRICSVKGCGRKHYAKDFCMKHYNNYLYKTNEHYRMKKIEANNRWNLKNPEKRKEIQRRCIKRRYIRNGGLTEKDKITRQKRYFKNHLIKKINHLRERLKDKVLTPVQLERLECYEKLYELQVIEKKDELPVCIIKNIKPNEA